MCLEAIFFTNFFSAALFFKFTDSHFVRIWALFDFLKYLTGHMTGDALLYALLEKSCVHEERYNLSLGEDSCASSP